MAWKPSTCGSRARIAVRSMMRMLSTPLASPVFSSAASSSASAGDEATTSFAGPTMRDTVCGAEFVRQLIAAETMTSLQGARWIVQAGVDYATIARARAHANFWKRFQNEDITPTGRERAGNRAPHDATADDYYAGLLHGFHCIRLIGSRF